MMASAVSGEPFPGFGACGPVYIPSYFFSFWIPIMAFEFLLLFFALYAGYTKVFRIHKVWDMNRLINVLIRDNIIYFAV